MEKRSVKETDIHFLYVVIIMGIVIIGLTAALFYPNKVAWDFLSFAGVTLSLVLSVIAILITLWDVAGQRQQVADIAESAKTLRETVDKQNESLVNLSESMRQIVNEEINNGLSNTLTDFKEEVENSQLNEQSKEEMKKFIEQKVEQERKNINASTVIPNPLFVNYKHVFPINRDLTPEEEIDIDNIIRKHDRANGVDIRIENGKIMLGYNLAKPLSTYTTQSDLRKIDIFLNNYLKQKGLSK